MTIEEIKKEIEKLSEEDRYTLLLAFDRGIFVKKRILWRDKEALLFGYVPSVLNEEFIKFFSIHFYRKQGIRIPDNLLLDEQSPYYSFMNRSVAAARLLEESDTKIGLSHIKSVSDQSKADAQLQLKFQEEVSRIASSPELLREFMLTVTAATQLATEYFSESLGEALQHMVQQLTIRSCYCVLRKVAAQDEQEFKISDREIEGLLKLEAKAIQRDFGRKLERGREKGFGYFDDVPAFEKAFDETAMQFSTCPTQPKFLKKLAILNSNRFKGRVMNARTLRDWLGSSKYKSWKLAQKHFWGANHN